MNQCKYCNCTTSIDRYSLVYFKGFGYIQGSHVVSLGIITESVCDNNLIC